MKKRNLLFPILFTIAVVLITLIPFQKIFSGSGLKGNTIIAASVAKLLIFSCLSFWTVRKWKLQDWCGFRKPIWRNQWLVILLFIYPGLLYYSGINVNNLEDGLLNTIVIYLITGVFEEISFRGIVQGYLTRNSTSSNYHRIFFTTAFLFGIAHFSNLRRTDLMETSTQVLGAFYIGLVLSVIQFRANNIWLLAIAHALLDLFSSLAGHETLPEAGTSFQLADYLKSIGSITIFYSPLLILYWFLTRNINSARARVPVGQT